MDQARIQQEFNEAIRFFESGQTEIAEQLLQNVARSLPNHPMVMQALATTYIQNQKADKAIPLLQKLVQQQPKQLEPLRLLATALEYNQQLEQAKKQLDKAIQKFPKQALLYFDRARLLLKSEQLEAAKSDLKQCLQIDPKQLDAKVNLGILLHQEGDLQAAKNTYQEVLDANQAHPEALLNMGHCMMDWGEADTAINYYMMGIKAHKGHELSWQALLKALTESGQHLLAEKYLSEALEQFPKSADILLLGGNLHRDLGGMDAAKEFYEKALTLDPSLEGAERNLRRMLSQKIPGWHFTMLGDEKRNNAYQQALEKVVKNDSVVLDIGTGSGLLSMMAARAGAKEVYACEMNQELAQAAKEIIKTNGYDAQIRLFEKKSNLLEPASDQLQKADILVSEILDVGVIGEGVLPSLRHAIAKLCKEDVQIIPAKASLYAQLIEIPLRSKLTPIQEISGFDLSYFDRFRIPNEYTTVHLQAEEYRALSEVFPLHEYDFYNIPAAIPDNLPQKKRLPITLNQSGELQAVVFWFDLYLDDEIVVSSREGGELKHWGQALYCFPNPQSVEAGQEVQLQLLHSDQFIRFEYSL